MRIYSSGIYFWLEEYLFECKTNGQKILSFILLPLSLLYACMSYAKRVLIKPIDYQVPVVSIGNLSLGGSGKTPFAVALAWALPCKVCVILRGYGRASRGLVQVSDGRQILCGVETSGDEAMLIAQEVPSAVVLVSEDRVEAILFAKMLGVECVLLDDGFSKCQIKKLDILLKPQEILNTRVLPSGCYREAPCCEKYADIVAIDGVDFTREVQMPSLPSNVLLLTSISKPKRLDAYLPKDIKKHYLKDHQSMSASQVNELVSEYGVEGILATQKDAVKLRELDLLCPIWVMDLHLRLSDKIIMQVREYIKL